MRERIKGAILWTVGGNLTGQLLRLISNLVLTRLLVPEMFGLMAIANVLIIGLNLMSDFGINQSVIKSSRGAESRFLNTAWTLQILRGFLIWLLATGFSFLILFLSNNDLFSGASTYADPELPGLIQSIAFSSIIAGFASMSLVSVNRELKLKKLVGIELSSQLISIMVMIGWAVYDRSINALIAGVIANSLIKTFLSHWLFPKIESKILIDRESFKEIFSFGKWVFLSSIVKFIASSGDRLILGYFIGSQLLGIYFIAYFIVNSVKMLLYQVQAKVALPYFSKVVREESGNIKNEYYRFRVISDAVVMGIAGLLLSSGEPLIDLLYDERYSQAGLMVQVLSLSLIEVRYGMSTQCFLALGKPNYLFNLNLLKMVLIYLCMPLAYLTYGMIGALWIAGTHTLLTIPLILFYKAKLNILSLKKEIMTMPMILVGLMIGILVF